MQEKICFRCLWAEGFRSAKQSGFQTRFTEDVAVERVSNPLYFAVQRRTMARVKLNLPEHFEFSTEIPVRISDINYGGHLGNDAVLSLIHEARLRFFKKYGFTELDIAGVGLVLTDAVIVYKSEGFHGDILQIEVTRDDFNKYGCDFFYRLTNKDTGNEIAVAKTGIVFFDREKKKVAEMPEKFRILGG